MQGKLYALSHRWAVKLVLSKRRGILGGLVRLPVGGGRRD